MKVYNSEVPRCDPTSRELFCQALKGQTTLRPPVWVMRQAGRYLPEYRALKERHSFTEMVRTPELAVEVTLQPLRRFALDAAILFSDILVIPEAMGQGYAFREGGGIQMAFKLDTPQAIHQLEARPDAIRRHLDYVPAALRILRSALPEKALLGFVGSPWTLGCYMSEGGSSKTYLGLPSLMQRAPAVFNELMEKLTAAVTELCLMKIEAGVDAIQIFDSNAFSCPQGQYEVASLGWIRRVIQALPEGFPVILFAKGKANEGAALLSTGARVLSLDETVQMDAFRRDNPGSYALQGNLPPEIMTTTPENVTRAVHELLQRMHGMGAHILNLGHGITPDAKIGCMEALIEAARNG